MFNKFLHNKKGFSLIETLTYLFITSILIILVTSIVTSIFNTRKQMRASYLVHNDARFIFNFLNNRIHNVDYMVDVSPASEHFHFYNSTSSRFSFGIEGDDLIYRETEDAGSGFPEQSTAEPVVVNSQHIQVNSFSFTSLSDVYGNPNQGVVIDFTLSTGNPSDIYGYSQKSFSTFMSIR